MCIFLVFSPLFGLQQEVMEYNTIVDAEQCSSDNEPRESSIESAKSRSSENEPIEQSFELAKGRSGLSTPIGTGNVWNENNSRAIQLSNRDRLLLRKQALRMKKRPVLAVGDFNFLFHTSCLHLLPVL